MKFKCESVNEVKGDQSVGYGRGAQAGVEDRAKADAEAAADRDADRKAKNEHECETGCSIRGVATRKRTTIVVPAWRDRNGVWHATAKCRWALTVHCVRSGIASRKVKARRAAKTPARAKKKAGKVRSGAARKPAGRK